jgi:hypothetical protein
VPRNFFAVNLICGLSDQHGYGIVKADAVPVCVRKDRFDRFAEAGSCVPPPWEPACVPSAGVVLSEQAAKEKSISIHDKATITPISFFIKASFTQFEFTDNL